MVGKWRGSKTAKSISRLQRRRHRGSRRIRQALVNSFALWVVALAPSIGQAGHPKIDRYSTAASAAKISVNLLRLEAQTRAEYITSRNAAAAMAVRTMGEGVRVNVLMSHLEPGFEEAFERAGATILHISERHRQVAVMVENLAVLHDLAEIPGVDMISPEYGAATHIGSVDSRASEALMADMVRLSSSLDGSGQTVGILSDSFARSDGVRNRHTDPALGVTGTLRNSTPQESGDLPETVMLLREGPRGRDEGAAMAELVHDVAPGAAIAFHTAFISESSFADGITELCSTAGATVVVDDVIYFAEPMYQDGIIAQAATACVNAGVPYFAAAGNQANRGFRQLFSDIAAPDDRAEVPTGDDLHDWGNGDGFLDVTLPAFGSVHIVLQWNQPFATVSLGHGAEVDLDLYVTPTPDAAGLADPITKSVEIQGTTGAPWGDAKEIAVVKNPTFHPLTVYIAVEHFDGSQDMIPQDATTPLEFRLVLFESNANGTTVQGISDGTSSFGGPTMYGHSVAPGVISVGAVPWFDTAMFNPAFSPSSIVDPEGFSSRGGAMSVQFSATGEFAPRHSQEPDIAAVDGNNTTFFGKSLDLAGFADEPDAFPNFFGTSAAAPNAAAVAALLLEFNPSLTPAEVTRALVDTAIDVVGFRAGIGWDDVTGAGLIDATAALEAVVQVPRAVIDTPAGNVTIRQGESVFFTGTISGLNGSSPSSFSWNFGGGAPNSSLEDPGKVTFKTPGTFMVTFMATDDQGVSRIASTTVNVRDGGGSSGGGCTMNPGASGDLTLILALGCIVTYLGRKQWQQPVG